MSYLLEFTSPKISLDDFYFYFQGRENYRVSDYQAWYENADTGAYFGFNYEKNYSEELGESIKFYFDINYFRPHFFYTEAAEELRELIEIFKFKCIDASDPEERERDFDLDMFSRDWHSGNDFSYHALSASKDMEDYVFFAVPPEITEEAWRWNRQRRVLLAQSGNQNKIIPRICYISQKNRIYTVCGWSDGLPAIIPKVDFIFIERNLLAPRKLWRRKSDVAQADFSEVSEKLGGTKEKEGIIYCDTETISGEGVKKYISSLKSASEEFEILPEEKILDYSKMKNLKFRQVLYYHSIPQ